MPRPPPPPLVDDSHWTSDKVLHDFLVVSYNAETMINKAKRRSLDAQLCKARALAVGVQESRLL